MSDAKEADTPATEQPKYVPKPDGADPFATRLVKEMKHDRGILACLYHPAGRYLFAGARDYFLHRWDLTLEAPMEEPDPAAKKPKVPPVPAAPAEARAQYEAHKSWISSLAFLGDGQRLVTGDFVGGIVVWSGVPEDPKVERSFEAHQGSIRAVAASPDGSMFASVGNDQMVRVWSATDGKLLLELTGHDCHVYNTAFHPDGKGLLSADLKGVVKHWEIPSGKLLRELDASLLHTYSVKYTVDVGGIRGIHFNANGTQLACAGATGDKGIAHSGNARVLLFDWKSGKLLNELKPEKDEIATAWGVRFHPDGFIVASGGSRTGGYLWFWVPENDVAFHMLQFKERAPGFALDLAPNDPRMLAVANHDGAVRLYEMAAEVVEEPVTEAK